MECISGIAAIIVLLLCIILKWQYSYWTRRGIQGPAPLPIFGNYFECFFMQKHFADVIAEIYSFLPKSKYVAFYKYHKPCLVVKDIELINRILYGDLSRNYELDFTVDENIYLIWKENVVKTKIWKQKSIQPEIRKLLSKEKFYDNYNSLRYTSQQLLDYIEDGMLRKQFEGFEAKELTTKFTMESLILAAIDIRANCFHDEEESIYLHFYRKYFTNHSSSLWLCFMKEALYQENVEHIVGDEVRREIRVRHGYHERKCFFDVLLPLGYNVNNDIIISHLLGLMEAFETANTLMAYCLYQLAINDDIQQKVRSEIEENLYLHDGELTEAVLDKLFYLDAVLFETLRLHSHLLVLNLKCKSRHNIPPQCEESKADMQLDEDVRVVVPIHSIHQDPSHYENPTDFNPERYFNIDNGMKIKYPYLGLGKESHFCLGMVYAFMQTKLGIATIVCKKTVKLSKKVGPKLNFSKKTLRLFYEEGIWLNFEPACS